MNKKKLSFIIGTTALVANLGFASILIANAQNSPGILEACPSVGFISTPTSLNFYLSESVNPPNTNPVDATSFTGDVYGSIDVNIAVCNPASSVSLYLYGTNFISADQVNSIPITDLELINVKPFTCKVPNNCTNETIPVDYTEGQNFIDSVNPGHIGSEDQFMLMTYHLSTDYPSGEQPSGFYTTTLDFHLPITAKPPGRYTNNFTITISQ